MSIPRLQRTLLLSLPALALAAALLSLSEASEPAFTEQQREYWAFQPVRRPELPRLRSPAWCRGPIDAFVLARLEDRRLGPSPEADRAALIRRLSLDLRGMPPEPSEVDAFLGDDAPDAFERAADRFLASPRHGERWGRHWLDLARYAESEGFKADETRPNAWRYRDWVIEALNADKPYDRFVAEQIAGDELWPDDPAARLATGFNRHYPDESNARDIRQRRQEILNDITDTTGATFLGLTVGCARCHDHKFDAILQADYYRLQAFFAAVRADDGIAVAPPEVVQAHRTRLAEWDEKTRALREAIAGIEEPHRREVVADKLKIFPEEIQDAVRTPAAERTPFQALMACKVEPQITADPKEVQKRIRGDEKTRWDELQRELASFAPLHPGELAAGIGIADTQAEAPPTHVLRGGAFNAPGEEVAPGFLSVLDDRSAEVRTPEGIASTGRRTALARWLTSASNPLSSRVIANRLWHYHLGRGIVATPSDFGVMGDAPTHPELLDWIAGDLLRAEWSLKALHRRIVASSTYRQSSAWSEDAAEVDPEGKLLWRYPRRRLEAEAVRDSALAVSGLLSRVVGGPSVFPELPPGMECRGGWPTSKDAEARCRRSVYIFVRRNTRYPLLEAFDFPDTHESCGRRHTTTTAPQALALLNSALALEWARGFAARVLAERNGEPAAPSQWTVGAYRLAFGRQPHREEADLALDFFRSQGAIARTRIEAGEEPALPLGGLPAGVEKDQAAALVDFCHVLLNANEFVFLP